MATGLARSEPLRALQMWARARSLAHVNTDGDATVHAQRARHNSCQSKTPGTLAPGDQRGRFAAQDRATSGRC